MNPIESVGAWWRRLTPRGRMITIGGSGAAGIAAVALSFGISEDCSARTDVEARVALTSSTLQQAAAQGALSVDRLADGVKRLNAAATAYETDKDAAAFCAALDKLAEDFDLE